jgi:hypothetical protein
MADSRMLRKSIATSEQMAAVSINAALLFTWCIPFLDIEGRMYGSPSRFKALVCPLRPELTPATIEQCLGELHGVGLVVWYEAAGGKWLAFPGFLRHNKVRADREAASIIPTPPFQAVVPPVISIPDYSGKPPGALQDDSGSAPAKGGKEGKGRKGRKPRASEASLGAAESEAPTFDYGPFVDAHRERFGTDPDKQDAKVLKALVRDHGHAEVLARWERYLAAKGQYGVNVFRRTWADWAAPGASDPVGGRARQTAERLYEILTTNGLLDAG